MIYKHVHKTLTYSTNQENQPGIVKNKNYYKE